MVRPQKVSEADRSLGGEGHDGDQRDDEREDYHCAIDAGMFVGPGRVQDEGSSPDLRIAVVPGVRDDLPCGIADVLHDSPRIVTGEVEDYGPVGSP